MRKAKVYIIENFAGVRDDISCWKNVFGSTSILLSKISSKQFPNSSFLFLAN